MTRGRDRSRGDRRRTDGARGQESEGAQPPEVPWWERRYGGESEQPAEPPRPRQAPTTSQDLDVAALRQSAGTGYSRDDAAVRTDPRMERGREREAARGGRARPRPDENRTTTETRRRRPPEDESARNPTGNPATNPTANPAANRTTAANERTTGSHSRVVPRSRGPRLPQWTVRPLDLQVLTWWFLTRVSLLVVAVSGPALFMPPDGAPSFIDRWGNWDVAHFSVIAERGYFDNDWDTPVEAFFPGLPLIMKLGLLIGLSPVITGLLVSLVAGGVAAVALARLAESEYGEGTGQKAALAWMIAPPAVFLAAPYTEALFLGFAVPSWLAARKGHWWLAGALAFGACGVRVSGLFLVIALVVEFATSKRRGRIENAGWLALPLVPLLAYMAYLWANTGDPLRWYHAQSEEWFRSFHWPWESLLNTVRAAQGEGFAADTVMRANWEWMFRAELVAMLVGVVLTVVLFTMRRWGEGTWVGLQIAAFSTSQWFFSVPRATLLWFPLWIGLGALSKGRPWVWRAYVVIAAPLFGIWATAYLLGKWAG